MKKAQYQVVNASGKLIKFFGSDYAGAVAFAAMHEGVGLMYGLRVKKYYTTS